MALHYPSDHPKPNRKRSKPKTDRLLMLEGVLMGLAVVGFAACLLLVLNGKAEEWLRQLREVPSLQRTSSRTGGR